MVNRYFPILMLTALLFGGCGSPRSTPLAEPATAEDRAMVAAVCPSYYERGKGTAAEFVTNTLSAGIPKRAVYLLLPERFEKEYTNFGCSKEAARQVIGQFKTDADRGFRWTVKNREIIIPIAIRPPVIDGELSQDEWTGAAKLQGEMLLDDGDAVPSGNTVWQVMYDREYLYFSVFFPDRDIRTGDKEIYHGDSLEMFVMPDRLMRTYWEVILSPDGRRFTAWHMASDHGGFTSRRNIRPEKLRTAVKKYPEGFAAEIAFPFSALPTLGKSLPFSGATVDFMMVRTNLDGGVIRRTVPVPLLYDGHNFAGYIRGNLK